MVALSPSPIHRSPPPSSTAEPGPRLDKTSLHQGLEKLSKNRINGYSI